MAFFFGNMGPSLHDAAKNGQQQAVYMMLAQGANVNTRDNFNRTPLHWAAEFGHQGVAQLLIQSRVDLEAQGKVGWTALHCAAAAGRDGIVRLLISSGANIEAKEFEGQTALQWAAYHGHLAVVQLLLQKGADITVRGKSGWTALNYASGRGHRAVAQVLTVATTSRGIVPQGPPLHLPQYNPFLRTNHQVMPQQVMPQQPSTHMSNFFSYNPQVHGHPTALGYGPSAPLQNQLFMEQEKAFAGDNQLVVAVPVNTVPSTNPWADFASQ